MTRPTINSINAALADRQIEIVKGCGYFYFMPAPDAPLDLELPDVESVYTCFLTDLSKEEWIAHVDRFFDEAGQ